MDLPQEASEGAKTAAFNSDINFRNYTAGGEFKKFLQWVWVRSLIVLLIQWIG